jgi:hypothetical protein
VLFLSTYYTGHEYQQRDRRRPTSTQPRARPIKRFFGDKVAKTVSIPSIAADYNDRMNAVDIGDHLRSSSGYDHRICRGGWQALAWTFLLDIALINSYILQHNGEPIFKRCESQAQRRGQLIDALCEAYGKTIEPATNLRRSHSINLPIEEKAHVALPVRVIALGSHARRALKSPLGPCLKMPSIAGPGAGASSEVRL